MRAAVPLGRSRGAIPPYEAGSAGILPVSVGTDRWEGKAVSPDRCLGDACRLESGAPGYGLLLQPLEKGGGLGRE